MQNVVKHHFCGLFLLAILTLCTTCPAFAQLANAGSISGTVLDSTGAVVPDTAIQIVNEGTRTILKSKSDSAGAFVVPALSPGQYTAIAVKDGFKTFKVTGIEVHPSLATGINITMSVGEITTSVTVESTTAGVQTASSEISSEVSAEEASTLPLNGRNFQSLSSLMPGVTNTQPGKAQTPAGFNQTNTMSINGMGTAGTAYFVDGMWDENTGNMLQITVTPNPDTIQEVRVMKNNYGVEYTLNGAAAVMVQTKSGTATFHGSAYEYFRNNAMDARPYFSPIVAPLHQNIYGYAIGGPLFIPHLYPRASSKTFFFWSQQWVRQDQGQTLTGITPTADQRAGKFTTLIKDPLTNAAFPQSSPGVYQIPANRISSDALALMNALFPLPNYSGSGNSNNYINQEPLVLRDRDDEIKVDHNFLQRFQLTAEYLDSRSTNTNPNNPNLSNSPFPSVRFLRNTPLQLAKVGLTQTFSPALVNTTSLAMNNYVTSFNAEGTTKLSQVPDYHQTLPYSGGALAADLLPQITFTGGYSPAGISGNVPQPHAGNLEDSFSDEVSYLHGNHYIQVGVQYVRGTSRQWSQGQNHGNWTFNGQFTGNAIADYLLGKASSLAQQSDRPHFIFFYRILSPYIQDHWKVNRRLTVNVGVRYEHYPGIRPASNTQSNFIPSKFDPTKVPTVTSSGTITVTPNYDPLNGLVVQGANGNPDTFTNGPTEFLAPSAGFSWDVFGNGRTAVRGGYGTSYVSLLGTVCQCYNNPPYVQSITLVTPNFPDSVGAAAAPTGAPTLNALDPQHFRMPMVNTYSLNVQQQLPGNWLFNLAGAGNFVRHSPQQLDLNQPTPTGVYDYDPVINAGTTFKYLYGPYRGYGAIQQRTNGANKYWNGLEASLRHPVGHDLFVSLAYTWQHALGDTPASLTGFQTSSSQDSLHPRRDYGNLATNVPNIFAGAVIWQAPFFRHSHGWKRQALGGWQISDVTTIQSGFSLSPGLSVSKPGLATRPNYIAGAQIKGPKTISQWFNTAAFVQAPVGYFGNAPVGSILGPGLINSDMALYKDFKVEGRNVIQFRAEAFNVFNHPNFNAVSTSLGAANYGQLTGTADPRIMELVFRYQF